MINSEYIKKICPKCEESLVELEEDLEGMSDGQLADYYAGFSRPFYCNKCKEFSLRDIAVFDFDDEDDYSYTKRLEGLKKGRRTAWNNKGIKGHIGEMWFANKLRNDGHKVVKTMYYDYETGCSILNENGITNLLQNYSKKKNLIRLLLTFSKGYPDLMCLKDNKVSFYEVKTNDSEIKEHQKEVMQTLKSKGYEVYTIRLDVDFTVNQNELFHIINK